MNKMVINPLTIQPPPPPRPPIEIWTRRDVYINPYQSHSDDEESAIALTNRHQLVAVEGHYIRVSEPNIIPNDMVLHVALTRNQLL